MITKSQKHFKSAISIILCLAILFSFCSLYSFAANNEGVSINAGGDALRAQFLRDKGPVKGGYAIDYSYFSPVKSSDDETKYPLVVFLPGGTESAYEGKELIANNFCNWSSIEYQSRFTDAGGAFLMIARAREELALSWNSSILTAPLNAAVKDFTQKHPNVDTQRIYVVGWCYGGTGAINQASEYPDFYAGAVIFAPSNGISSSEAARMKNTAVWLDISKGDSFSLYGTVGKPSWDRLVDKTTDKQRIRLTAYDDAPDAGALFSHNTWHDACYDMNSGSSNYKGMKTIDGNGNTIDARSEGMISWLSAQRLKTDEPTPTPPQDDKCSCNCHSTNFFTKLFWKIQVLFWKIFNVSNKQTCQCGKAHWRV